MKDTFSQIDTLEAGVKTVESSINSMELELTKAETQLGSESVFKTVFRPFLVISLLELYFFLLLIMISIHRNRAVPPHLKHPALTIQFLSSTLMKFGLMKGNYNILLQTKVYLNHLKSLCNKCHTQGIGNYFKYTRRKRLERLKHSNSWGLRWLLVSQWQWVYCPQYLSQKKCYSPYQTCSLLLWKVEAAHQLSQQHFHTPVSRKSTISLKPKSQTKICYYSDSIYYHSLVGHIS